MAPRLKVFITSDGLTDYVVAAASKPKALAAWGSRQDLFKTGLAHETDDAELVKAASVRPGEVLRRPAGGRGDLARLKVRKAPAKPAGPSKAALKKLAELEARLTRLDAAHQAALGKLQDQRTRLDEKIAALEEGHAAERTRLETALKAARQAPG
ncbi:MAG: hypothetical protein E7812_00915 [Phenylobacterium sp.]|nr:MAG: hypothetical protein E7812_00915 [Phenylobacterium sp.]